jgi:hypothetical protein
MSALRVPVSLFGGRQLSACESVDFQQLFPASQAQSRLAEDELLPSPPLEQSIPSEMMANSIANDRRIEPA